MCADTLNIVQLIDIRDAEVVQWKGCECMSHVKEKAIDLITDVPDDVVVEVIDFIEYLMTKKKGDKFKDLINASESGIGFWLNEEDEVWDNV